MKLKEIIATSLGNTLEWFDFGLFIFMAPLIGAKFFPHQSAQAATLEALAVFAAGFICRPLGGIILGHMGDTQGRAKTLRLSIMLITLTTLFVGLLPTYDNAGLLASLLFTLLRLIQGISIGGEYSGVMIYLAESAPKRRRGFITSFSGAGANLGFLMATLVFMLLKSMFSPVAITNWAWRLPFLLAGIPGSIILYYRLRLAETRVYKSLEKRKRITRAPLLTAFKLAPQQLVKIFGLTAMGATFYYVFFGYMSTYMEQVIGMNAKTALLLQSIALTCMLFTVPLMGIIGDFASRKRMLYVASGGAIICALPCFLLIQTKTLAGAVVALGIAAIISSIDQGNTQTAAVENCPENIRYSGIAFSYNLGNAIFGGTAPLMVTYLTQQQGILAPAYYIMLMASISLVTVTTLLSKNRHMGAVDLEQDYIPAPVSS